MGIYHCALVDDASYDVIKVFSLRRMCHAVFVWLWFVEVVVAIIACVCTRVVREFDAVQVDFTCT